MKRILIVLLLVLCLIPMQGQASPDIEQYRAVLHPTFQMTGIFAEPFDRWAKELGDMLAPVVQQARWPEGESLSMDIVACGESAIRFELIQTGELISLSCNLMGDGQVLLTGDKALSAMYLMDNLRWGLTPDTDWPNADCTLNVNASELGTHLLNLSKVFASWAEDAPQDDKDCAQAVAAMCQSLGKMMKEQPEATPVVSVFVHYEAPNLLPQEVDKQAPAAPDSLLGNLLAAAPEKLARTIGDAWAAEAAAVQTAPDDVK